LSEEDIVQQIGGNHVGLYEITKISTLHTSNVIRVDGRVIIQGMLKENARSIILLAVIKNERANVVRYYWDT
jgi:hypothetical protein